MMDQNPQFAENEKEPKSCLLFVLMIYLMIQVSFERDICCL